VLEESQHHTGHQTFIFNLFILIYLNCASRAAFQQGVAASHGTLDFLFCVLFIIFYLNGASGTALQQGIAAPDGAPDFLFLLLFI
jgi:hypothetical protein